MSAQDGARTIGADVYLIVKAERGWVSDHIAGSGEPIRSSRVKGAKVTGSRQSPPARLARDEVAVKVRVRIPVGAFEPLSLGVTADVPVELVLRRAVLDVEALAAEPPEEPT